MGFSKKKARNFRKASARVGDKAKQKVKQARQIEARSEFKASKRRAAAATGAGAGKAGGGADGAGGDLSEVKSVDALFARLGAEEDEEGSDDESSAGAFHDIGSDDGGELQGAVDEDDELAGPGAAAKHAEELRAIKEKDPEFYKFLVEQDKVLLDFAAPGDDERDEEEGGEGQEEEEEGEGGLRGPDLAGEGAASQGRVLTRERLERIQASAKDSFMACKAALNIYHTAVRSIEAKNEQAAADEDDKDGADGEGARRKKRKQRQRSAAKERKARQRIFIIDDEAIFSDVIEWSLGNFLDLFKLYAGEARSAVSSSGRGGKKRRGAQKEAAAAATEAKPGPLDPTTCQRWLRVRVLAHIFWEDTFVLLNHLVAQEMLEAVLRFCSTPEALAWLWPFTAARQKYLKRVSFLWATAGAQEVRLLAFLFLRNSAAMVMCSTEDAKGEATQLEALIKLALRAFADVASHGYSWRSISSFRFLENCIVELLRLDDATAYRLGYVCLRQLALILRNACLNVAAGTGGPGSAKAKAKAQEKAMEKAKERVKADSGQKKQKGAKQQAQTLLSWPFVRSISLWTRAVGALPALEPLAYPLSMITLGAAKHRLTSLQMFPFVNQCFLALNRLGAQLETFVPVSAHLLKVLGIVVEAIEKAHRRKRSPGEGKALDSQVKAPDIEISLRLSEGQLSEPLVLEAIGGCLCGLFADHLGLLSQSPGFPEVGAPVFLHLRKHSKHCRSEAIRRQLKTLIEKCEASADVVRARREQLEAPPDAKKFLIFDADTPIAKARLEVIRRRGAEERARIEAELSGDVAATKEAHKRRVSGRGDTEAAPVVVVPEGQKPPGQGTSKKAIKRRAAAALKERAAAGATEEAAADAGEPTKKARRSVREQARRAGSLPDRDRLEQMDFGSDADD